MIVVRGEDYAAAIQKLEDSGFISSTPNRCPPPEVMEYLPNPQLVLDEINEQYKNLDGSTRTFNYPTRYRESKEQVVLIPNSFAHLPLETSVLASSETMFGHTIATSRYDVYRNIFYPLEQVLVESFVKAAVDEENDIDISDWGELLRAWISMMVGYLEVNNDILDNCLDGRAMEWFSVHFGREREAKFGPFDLRISKRLGSGREMPVNMRGQPVICG